MSWISPFELFVALRYLLAKRKQAFISLISLISAVGVMVGVMAVLIALALMTGLQGELRDRLVGSAAHIYVLKAGGLKNPQAEMQASARPCRTSSAPRPSSREGLISDRDGGAGVRRNERRHPGAGAHGDADRAGNGRGQSSTR